MRFIIRILLDETGQKKKRTKKEQQKVLRGREMDLVSVVVGAFNMRVKRRLSISLPPLPTFKIDFHLI